MTIAIQRISDGQYVSNFEEGDGYRGFVFTENRLNALLVDEALAYRICDIDFETGKPFSNRARNKKEYRRVLVRSRPVAE
jgi:hypothetical protein